MAKSTKEYKKMLSEVNINDIKIKGCLKEGVRGVFKEYKDVPDASTLIRPERATREGAKILKEILGDIY